jgi:hypothetical protein
VEALRDIAYERARLACLEKSSVAITEINYRGYNIFGRHRFARQFFLMNFLMIMALVSAP